MCGRNQSPDQKSQVRYLKLKLKLLFCDSSKSTFSYLWFSLLSHKHRKSAKYYVRDGSCQLLVQLLVEQINNQLLVNLAKTTSCQLLIASWKNKQLVASCQLLVGQINNQLLVAKTQGLVKWEIFLNQAPGSKNQRFFKILLNFKNFHKFFLI